MSAGEKQLLAISLLWGLARVSEKHLPVAIDTPLARLDSSHRQNLIERYFPTASHQVILLSTDTEIGKAEVEFVKRKKCHRQRVCFGLQFPRKSHYGKVRLFLVIYYFVIKNT